MSFPGGVATDDAFQVENTSIQTTGATSTLLWTRAIPTLSVARFRAVVVGMKSDGTDRASYTMEFTAYRGTGDVAQGGATAVPALDYESDATWGGPAVTTDTATEAVRIAVVGKAATTINWRCRVELLAG